MNRFRAITLASTLVFCIWFFLPFAPLVVSEDVRRILSLSGYGAFISLSHPVIFICSFAWRIAAMVGIFLYKRWSVPLLGIWLLINILLSPFGGVVVYTGIDTMVGYIATLLDGIVLCLAYLNVWQGRRLG